VSINEQPLGAHSKGSTRLVGILVADRRFIPVQVAVGFCCPLLSFNSTVFGRVGNPDHHERGIVNPHECHTQDGVIEEVRGFAPLLKPAERFLGFGLGHRFPSP